MSDRTKKFCGVLEVLSNAMCLDSFVSPLSMEMTCNAYSYVQFCKQSQGSDSDPTRTQPGANSD